MYYIPVLLVLLFEDPLTKEPLTVCYIQLKVELFNMFSDINIYICKMLEKALLYTHPTIMDKRNSFFC